ncbi:MAG: saccharopine dehydrogenase [Bacteroidetes bacterium]|nr:MAG: saccharopine dehydrogenase [Bacteroidota bacterium]
MKFLLYGANGYTGQLIIRFAAEYGLTPVLAGRTAAKIEPLAKKYGLDFRIFDLADAQKTDNVLREVPVVLHVAGPFKYTARPMIDACLRTGTHYLDITGEIEVFEMAAALDDKARQAGIMLMPGTGFDVVPTDCMAVYLKNKLPDATHLRLAFADLGGGVSHGTALTMAENLGEGSYVRENGQLKKVPMGHKTLEIPYGEKKIFCMTIPWGDLATAWRSTGIPNIETYVATPPAQYKMVKRMNWFNWLLRTEWARNLARKRVNARPGGPSDEKRERAKSVVWGEVRNAKGDTRQALLVTPQGYTVTAHASLIIARKVLEGNAPVGYQTPAMAYGADLILEVPDTRREDLD